MKAWKLSKTSPGTLQREEYGVSGGKKKMSSCLSSLIQSAFPHLKLSITHIILKILCLPKVRKVNRIDLKIRVFCIWFRALIWNFQLMMCMTTSYCKNCYQDNDFSLIPNRNKYLLMLHIDIIVNMHVNKCISHVDIFD